MTLDYALAGVVIAATGAAAGTLGTGSVLRGIFAGVLFGAAAVVAFATRADIDGPDRGPRR